RLGRLVALEVRHAARRFQRRTRTAVAAGEAAVPGPARLRPRATRQAIREGPRSRRRTNPCTPPGQYVEPDLGQHLPAGGSARGRSRLRPYQNLEREEGGRTRD